MFLLHKKSAEEKFWHWFQKNEADLFDFERNQDSVFRQLSTELRKIHSDLTFEFSPKREDATREFVVSAGGITAAFPAVVALVKISPKLERWKITAFRPRRWPLNNLEFAGKHIFAEEVEFSLLDDGQVAGVYLYIPGYVEDDMNYKQIGYLMLDEALGEYDVETGVGLIKMFATEAMTKCGRFPLTELPSKFDQLQAKLRGPKRPS